MMAVVDRALREVVVLVGVPLFNVSWGLRTGCNGSPAHGQGRTHGISDGVSGLDPGGGRLVSVGCDVCAMAGDSESGRDLVCRVCVTVRFEVYRVLLVINIETIEDRTLDAAGVGGRWELRFDLRAVCCYVGDLTSDLTGDEDQRYEAPTL